MLSISKDRKDLIVGAIWSVFMIFAAFHVAKAQETENATSATVLQGHLNAMVTNYIELKDALVNNNSEQAARESREFWTYLNEITTNGVKASRQKQWKVGKLRIMDRLVQIANTADLATQREVFAEITRLTENLLNDFGHPGQDLYKQYCPMALEGDGAYWLNEKKEILNPYGGTQMLHCGKIVDTLKSAGAG